MISLLELFGYLNDNQTQLLLEEPNQLLGSQSVHQHNNELCDNERSDISLSSLSLPCDRQNGQSNSGDDTNGKSIPTILCRTAFKDLYSDDRELSTSPVEEGFFLDHIVESPLEVCILLFRPLLR